MVEIQRRSSCFDLKHFSKKFVGTRRHLVFLLAFGTLLLPSSNAHAEILFEGYSKVLLDGKHVGYIVQRYEYDTKKQEFTTAYYLKTSPVAGNITESLKARSTQALKPISFQFTELTGSHTKTIDAQFKNDTMTALIDDGGKKETISKKIPKTSFLSSFLAYVMLNGKDGIKKGVKYSYSAIAEEDATLNSGEAFISGEEPTEGINAFKILNTFKSAQFVSWCTYKGEVIATRSPVQKISTELVATAHEATEGLTMSAAALTQLFGNVPRGVDNPIARRSLEPAARVKTAEKPNNASADKTVEKPQDPQSPGPKAIESTETPKAN